MNIRITLAFLSLAVMPAVAHAQQLELPRPSPSARVSQAVGVTEIAVEYSSPAVNGRGIWGGLVPFGQLWHTGANAATKITFSKDATVAGKPVPAGSYSVFTIPNKDAWTFILNKNATAQTRDYKQELDVVRVELKPQAMATARERMTFLFSNTTERATALELEWEKLRLSVPITVDTDAQVAASMKALGDNAWRPYNSAARYLLDAKKYDEALGMVEKSLGLREDWLNVWTKAQILAGKGRYKEALPLAERANALGQKAEYFFFADDVKKALAEWKTKK